MTHFGRNGIAGAIQCDSSGIIYNNSVRAALNDENIKNIRKSKGFSQEELARRLNVVRQTVSKWEQGTSVPDSEMLIRLAEVLETPVSVLLGETVEPQEPAEPGIRELAEKLEQINSRLAQEQERRRKLRHGVFLVLLILSIGGVLLTLQGIWSYSEIHHSIGIIGGADGPTQIFVTTAPPDLWSLVLPLVFFALMLWGFIRTRRR